MKKASIPHSISWKEATPWIRYGATSSASPGYVIPRRWFAKEITDFDLWLVCAGGIELEDSRGSIRSLGRGAVVLLRPGENFELRVVGEESYTNAFIHFDFVDLRGRVIPCHRVADLPPVVGHVQDVHYFEAAMRRLFFLQYQLPQVEASTAAAIRDLSGNLLKGLLQDYQVNQQLADEVSRTGLEKHHRQKAEAALSWMYLHPETRLSAADLAQKFGYSQRHFRRIFQQAHGKTPGQALIEAKIDHAKKLLSGSALNVTEIAASLNYENVFYFSRQFRQVAGLSPLKFRRRLRA